MNILMSRVRRRANSGSSSPGGEQPDVEECAAARVQDLRRPAVIIRPVDATEVSYVVSLARDTGLELAVRSGGHSVAGHSASEGGIMLDLHNLRALDIDIEHRMAWAGSGLTAAEYIRATNAHGLATGLGDTIRIEALNDFAGGNEY